MTAHQEQNSKYNVSELPIRGHVRLALWQNRGMAKETIVRLVDDLDGMPIDEDGSTVTFALEGRTYEIDLSPANVEKLRQVMSPFVSSARPVSGRRDSGGAGRSRTRRAGRGSLQDVREWARGNGYVISERGRIPQAISEAYATAQQR